MDIISAAVVAFGLFVGTLPANEGSTVSTCDMRNRPIEVSTSHGGKTYLGTNHAGKACGNVFSSGGQSESKDSRSSDGGKK